VDELLAPGTLLIGALGWLVGGLAGTLLLGGLPGALLLGVILARLSACSSTAEAEYLGGGGPLGLADSGNRPF
jgi:hypothetical protein